VTLGSVVVASDKHVSHIIEHDVLKKWDSVAIDLEKHIGFKAALHLLLSVASLQ